MKMILIETCNECPESRIRDSIADMYCVKLSQDQNVVDRFSIHPNCPLEEASFQKQFLSHGKVLKLREHYLTWTDAYIPLGTTGYYVYIGYKSGEYMEKVRVHGAYVQKFSLKKLPYLNLDTFKGSLYVAVAAYQDVKPYVKRESRKSNEVIYTH